MNLADKIITDMRLAMKEQNKALSTLRMLVSALQNQKIALGHELNDSEVLSLLEKQSKQRKDSIEQYKAGGRNDLAENELLELKIIESYLPDKLDDAALEKLIEEVINEIGASGISDMGRAIKLSMERAAGAADGKKVSELVKRKLENV